MGLFCVNATVAQLVERWLEEPGVGGSIPLGGTMEEILKRLKKKPGFSAIERTLELRPFGLLSEWEKDISKIPPEGIALLKTIDTFPWLLRVADNKYKDASEILIDEGLIKPELKIQKKIENKDW